MAYVYENRFGNAVELGVGLTDFARVDIYTILDAYVRGIGSELRPKELKGSEDVIHGLVHAEWSAIAKEVKRCEQTCTKYVGRWLDGDADALQHNMGGATSDVLGPDGRYALLHYVRKYRSNYLPSYAEWLTAYLGREVTVATVTHQLQYFGITRKKLDRIYAESLTDAIIAEVRVHTTYMQSEVEKGELDYKIWIDVRATKL